jgi:ATP-dependent Clp endopeptidase proteolytic subunit ClpP
MSRYREHLRARADAPEPWYRIRDAADGDATSAHIDLYDEIDPYWGISAADFVADLRKLDVKDIQLHINSPGGAVYDGIAIMNALRQHPATVTTTVDGLAASAAGFIAVGASDELVMAENSELMIHNGWGLVVGDADDMRKMAADLERCNANIASIYQRKAGGDVDEWLSAMKDETWYSADEAAEAGLADRVEKAPKAKPAAKSAWDLSIYNFAGRSAAPNPLRRARGGPVPNRKERPVATLDEGLRELLGTDADAGDEVLIDKVKAAIADRDAALQLADEASTAKAAVKLPDGVVAVDAAMFDELKAKAERGAAAAVRQEADDRDRLLDDAIRAGKFAPAARAAYAKVLEDSPEGGAALLNSLAAGVIPVEGTEIGHSGEPEITMSDADANAVFARITGVEWTA